MPPEQPKLSPDELDEIDKELRALAGETRPAVSPDALAALAAGGATIPIVRTPPNAGGAPAVAPRVEDATLAVSFSPSPDEFFNSAVTLTIRCAVVGARIYYALGTKDVDDKGTVYDPQNPVVLEQSTLVAARAYADGRMGPVSSAQFDIVKPVWKELEPQDQSDPSPHKMSENLTVAGGWQIAAGSVRGKLHAHRGSWREDSFALGQVETGSGAWSVIVVSDGAGSAPLSRVGSKVACATALSSLSTGLRMLGGLSGDKELLIAQDLPALRQILMQAGADALTAIQAEARTREKSVSSFAATLLVLVQRDWNGAQLCSALQVGDGAIALWDSEKIVLLGEADHGQNSGETRFLTTTGIENELAARVRFSIKQQLQGVAVMSDGVSDDYFPEDPKLAELFAAVLPVAQSAPDAGGALISWLGYEKRGSSDDRTLVVGWLAGTEANRGG
ncbi:hypothetical protein IAD21_04151 [Abditibacteriota bacterium]|nr:hypothetical protein IAD21_04151 [Abditibacteriota bacterium]